MVLRRWLIVLLLLLPLTAGAQVEEALEQWVEETDDSQAAADLSDLLLQLQAHPVNLNDTLAVAQLPFITPFQFKALRNYILLHGQLMSHKELLFIPGFDSSTVALIEPFTTVAPYSPQKRLRLLDGRHNIVMGIGGTVEQAEGYRNGKYEGDNLHALLCYTYNLHNHVQLRLTADKDPAEAWGKENYYGYHLMLSDLGRLERLIIGRYNLQFGQGLTLWTGLRPFNLLGASPMRFGAGIRPAAAFYEEGYQEGVAARVNLGRGFHLSGFGSLVEEVGLTGAHLDYRKGNLIVGLTATYTLLKDSLETRDYVYNQNRFRGQQQLNGGLDVAYQWHHLTLYGEAAIGETGTPAAIGGLWLQADSRNRFGVSCRYYHPQYHNLHAQGYAIGSTQGEQGVTLDAENRLPLNLTLLTSLDLHRFPSLRYATYSPTSGAWLRLQLSRPWGTRVVTSMRYAYRQKERNIPNLDTTLYLGEQNLRQQLQGEVRATLGRWSVTARGIYALYESDHNTPQQGWLASLSARYSHRHLQATAGMAYYNIDGYYARIYLSESNLQYAWSMPALYGQGLRGHLVVRYRFGEHLTLAAKYCLSAQPKEEALGSGDAKTEGPVRQTWMAQLRCSF